MIIRTRSASRLTYGLYQACMKDNYSLEDLMGILAEKMQNKGMQKKMKRISEQ